MSAMLALVATTPAHAAQNGHLPDSELAEIYLPGGTARLQKDAAAAWNAMRQFCISKGVDIYPNGPNSAYRTVAQQVNMKRLYGSNAATPGTSNHGLGLAVDVATHAMRSIIDKYGAQFGWSKKWSDAQWEWWHIKYKPGVWDGRDRVTGPVTKAKTQATATATAPTEPSKGITDRLAGVGTSGGPTDTSALDDSHPDGEDRPTPPSVTAAPATPAPTTPAPTTPAPTTPPPTTPPAVTNNGSRFTPSSPMNEPLGVDPGDQTATASSAPSRPTTDASTPAAATTPAAPAAPTATPIAPSPLPTLSRGDHGAAVVTLQTALARMGYTITPNGTFDAQTERCVKAYEKSNHLRPDGIVGPKVWAELTADGR